MSNVVHELQEVILDINVKLLERIMYNNVKLYSNLTLVDQYSHIAVENKKLCIVAKRVYVKDHLSNNVRHT